MTISLRFISSLNDICAAAWDALFPTDYPFTRHAFLVALEQGGSVDGKSGWHSQHLALWHDDLLIAAVPGYVKTHSYGEYLFDWQIAEAYQQYQLAFYPKWIAAIPFTPVTGPRLGLHQDYTDSQILPLISEYLQEALNKKQFSCVQWLYPEPSFSQQLASQGFWLRHDVQFLWYNRSYTQFSDFLATLTSRKRKQILKERDGCKSVILNNASGYRAQQARLATNYSLLSSHLS